MKQTIPTKQNEPTYHDISVAGDELKINEPCLAMRLEKYAQRRGVSVQDAVTTALEAACNA